MSEGTGPSVTHATFTLERDYPAPPERVFAQWADPEAKAAWFAGPGSEHELDFREGGLEVARGRNSAGTPLRFESLYREIREHRRIVYTSVLYEGKVPATVSLTTVEFEPTSAGTRLTVTEQGAYLDGREEPQWREQGTSSQLDALDMMLKEVEKP